MSVMQEGHRKSEKRRRYPIARVKGGWSTAEDDALRRLVAQFGEGNWSAISKELNRLFAKSESDGRIGKQCRERWNHHLHPGIRKEAWTADEETAFVAAHRQHGNRWSDIARVLPGRTENAVKNHYHATLRRKYADGPGGGPSVLKEYLMGLAAGQAARPGAAAAAAAAAGPGSKAAAGGGGGSSSSSGRLSESEDGADWQPLPPSCKRRRGASSRDSSISALDVAALATPRAAPVAGAADAGSCELQAAEILSAIRHMQQPQHTIALAAH